MPGFDGTGPQGDGPMTGGGRGDCVTDASNARGGFGRGMGRGLGRGFGRGRASAQGRGLGLGRRGRR